MWLLLFDLHATGLNLEKHDSFGLNAAAMLIVHKVHTPLCQGETQLQKNRNQQPPDGHGKIGTRALHM